MYHTVLGSSPGAAIFGRDMLFDIPYLVDWNKIGNRRQAQIDRDALRKNREWVDFDYEVGQKCLLRKDGNLRKSETESEGPYLITQIYTNGNIRIQRGRISERLNIKRVIPYHEDT